MWQDIQAVTDNKPTFSLYESNASLPGTLNNFSAQFDAHNTEPPTTIYSPLKWEDYLPDHRCIETNPIQGKPL